MTHTQDNWLQNLSDMEARAANSQLTPCPSGNCEKLFLITYGDPGLDEHNLGTLLPAAARTHQNEIARNRFPGQPHYHANRDKIVVAHCTDAMAFLATLDDAAPKIGYLSYFGHSWSGWDWGLLYIGEEDAPATNFGSVGMPRPNDVPVTTMMRSQFYDNAQVRLFGCRCGYGEYPVALQMAAHLGVDCYGYANSGGSLFTNDISLGHGNRRTTNRDIHARITTRRDVWLIPANGWPVFKEFRRNA